MEVSLVPLSDVISLDEAPRSELVRFNIFATCGTKGCRLDCQAWEAIHSYKDQVAITARSDRLDLKKSQVQLYKSQQKQPDVAEPRVDKSSREGRTPFSIADLDASRKNGCNSCGFQHALLTCIISTRADLSRSSEKLIFTWIRYTFSLSIMNETNGLSLTLHLFRHPASRAVVHGMPLSIMLDGDTSSETSFGRARRWIQECEDQHQQCGTGRHVALPKRLIDLEPLDPCNLDSSGVRLSTTEGMIGTYVCLSHCWGKAPMPVRTTSQTLSTYTNLIPWTQLPRTFQDAILITHRLGLRYLWIDSICIIQDSDDDWQIESGKMSSIYRDSFLTIAAVSSPDFTGGCFSRGEAADLCLRVKIKERPDILMGVRDGSAAAREPGERYGAFQPLQTRAWCYQERILSRRVLHCTYGELSLECRTRRRCECGNSLSSDLAPHVTFRPGITLSTKKDYSRKGTLPSDGLYAYWQRIVMDYTQLQLSYGTDKLPALSGCAKDFARHLPGDTYLAGLWRNNFAEGLLWLVKKPTKQRRPPFRAPSWSWASVDTSAGVSYNQQRLSSVDRSAFRDRIETVECIPAGKDTTGAVASGALRIRSRLCPTYLRLFCVKCRNPTAIYNLDMTAAGCSCTFSVRRLDRGGVATVGFHRDFKFQGQEDFDFSIGTRKAGACMLAPIFLLHLYDTQSPSAATIKDSVTDYFLVLRRLATVADDTYERVALVLMTFPNFEERNTWFRDVYLVETDGEKLVCIL